MDEAERWTSNESRNVCRNYEREQGISCLTTTTRIAVKNKGSKEREVESQEWDGREVTTWMDNEVSPHRSLFDHNIPMRQTNVPSSNLPKSRWFLSWLPPSTHFTLLSDCALTLWAWICSMLCFTTRFRMRMRIHHHSWHVSLDRDYSNSFLSLWRRRGTYHKIRLQLGILVELFSKTKRNHEAIRLLPLSRWRLWSSNNLWSVSSEVISRCSFLPTPMGLSFQEIE
jgi:hypothetical protein